MAPDFTSVYREHYPAVLRFVRRRADPADVDDIVADTFLTAWQKQEEMSVAPLPWLYRTARNTMLNATRANGRRTALQVRIVGDNSTDAGRDPAAVVGERHDFADAWHRLDPIDREVLALQAWEGMSAAEAAAVLGISRAACSMRSSRARRRFGVHLDAAEEHTDNSDAPATPTDPHLVTIGTPPHA